MERGTLVVKGEAKAAHTLLTGTESAEVLGSLGRHVAKQLKVNTTRGRTANGNVHEHVGSLTFKVLTGTTTTTTTTIATAAASSNLTTVRDDNSLGNISLRRPKCLHPLHNLLATDNLAKHDILSV